MAQENAKVPDHENTTTHKQEEVEINPKEQGTAESEPTTPGDKFTPYDIHTSPRIPSGLPPDLWTLIQCAPANFAPTHFLSVTRNLLENPNLTASHLARAELSYTSFTDATFNPCAKTPEDLASITKHLRPECRPRLLRDGGIEGFTLEYTVVRKLVPRNPKLDDALMQTCHLLVSNEDIKLTNGDKEEEEEEEVVVKAERYMVVYMPHVDPNNGHAHIPFYHPKVRALAILYTYFPAGTGIAAKNVASAGVLSVYYDLFPQQPLDNRLQRTALKLAEVIHKHARGRQAGYKKRVHHDQIIGQKRFQDTYAELKGKYAKALIEAWVEQTPPEKHVFEDLGIAAFLEELWIDMYGGAVTATREDNGEEMTEAYAHSKKAAAAHENFPGFVDIGCGNGLLVSILNARGWPGWGFDARHRKSWDTFPDAHAQKLREMLLVPAIIQPCSLTTAAATASTEISHTTTPHHNGIFPPKTFIISNHADELTPWTPLLAYLNASPFIAIPCCSHDLGGTRFRAPVHARHVIPDPATETARKKNKQPSAYASLCSWICHLAEETGYKVEKEHLRIPSTRNVAVVGRTRVGQGVRGQDEKGELEQRLSFLTKLVEKEMGGLSVEQVGAMWMKSGDGLLKPGKGGH
ncbi:tRNA(Ser) Um(44) 2'-O-methyltransferase [Exserohilum turcicum]